MQDGAIRERLLRDAVLSGDTVAWRTWYAEAYGPLEAYVLWRCGRLRDLADEVLQETWLTAVRSLRRFQPEAGTFIGWLRGIAANVIRNQLRGSKRRESRQQPLSREPACDGVTATDERSERIAVVLAALPERYEEVLRAKYLDRLTVAEIAATWHETSKAIESLLTRARTAFREAFTLQEPDYATG